MLHWFLILIVSNDSNERRYWQKIISCGKRWWETTISCTAAVAKTKQQPILLVLEVSFGKGWSLITDWLWAKKRALYFKGSSRTSLCDAVNPVSEVCLVRSLSEFYKQHKPLKLIDMNNVSISSHSQHLQTSPYTHYVYLSFPCSHPVQPYRRFFPALNM